MDARTILDKIWSQVDHFHTSPDDKPTHVLLDPRSFGTLMHAAHDFLPLMPISRERRTVFDLPVIEVYRYGHGPFIALAKLAIATEEPK